MNIEELWDLVNSDNAKISNMLMRKAYTLRDTRSYWWRAKIELKSFVYNLEILSVFFMINAVDFQWDNLYQHMLNKKKYFNVIQSQRHSLIFRLI